LTPITAAFGSLVMGCGMGLVSVTSLVMIQEIVPWSERGSATASNIFARNLGSTLGTTVLGAVLNFGLSRSGIIIGSDQLRQLLEGQEKDGGTTGILFALQDALHLTFGAMMLISLMIVFMAALVPPIAINRS
jgi:MFS family permease